MIRTVPIIEYKHATEFTGVHDTSNVSEIDTSRD